MKKLLAIVVVVLMASVLVGGCCSMCKCGGKGNTAAQPVKPETK